MSETVYSEILSFTTKHLTVSSYMNPLKDTTKKSAEKILNTAIQPIGSSVFYPETVYSEILSVQTLEAIESATNYVGKVNTSLSYVDYEEPPLSKLDESNFNYGLFNGTKESGGSLTLEKTRENEEQVVISSYRSTQEGWSYGYGYEIEVTESVNLKKVEAYYSLNNNMKVKACVFKDTDSGWVKIAEAVNQVAATTENWVLVDGLNVVLEENEKYRIISYTEYSRDIHWNNNNIHPRELSFGEVVQSVSDSTRFDALGNFRVYNDKNLYMKFTVDGLYKPQGSFESSWQFNGFNPQLDVVSFSNKLPPKTSGNITIKSSNDRGTINNQETFDLVNHPQYANYTSSLIEDNYVKFEVTLNTSNLTKTPELKYIKTHGYSDPSKIVTSYIRGTEGKAYSNPRIVSSHVNTLKSDLRYSYFTKGVFRYPVSIVKHLDGNSNAINVTRVTSYVNNIFSKYEGKNTYVVTSSIKPIYSRGIRSIEKSANSYINKVEQNILKEVSVLLDSYLNPISSSTSNLIMVSSYIDKIRDKIATNPTTVISNVETINSKTNGFRVVESYIKKSEGNTRVLKGRGVNSFVFGIQSESGLEVDIELDSYISELKSDYGRSISVEINSDIINLNGNLYKKGLVNPNSYIRLDTDSSRKGVGLRVASSWVKKVQQGFKDYYGNITVTGTLAPASVVKGEFKGEIRLDGIVNLEYPEEIIFFGKYYSK